jgi:hypothetical protein
VFGWMTMRRPLLAVVPPLGLMVCCARAVPAVSASATTIPINPTHRANGV